MKIGDPLVPKSPLRFALAGSTALVLLAMSYSSLAATATWTGSGPDANWQTVGNWVGGAGTSNIPASGDALQFSGVTQLTANNDFAANTLFNGLTFNSDAGAFTLTGNAINLGGDIVNNSTNIQTINLNLALTAARTINAASGDIAIGGVISGGFALTKSGAGTLTLAGANTYSGSTTVGAGTLKLGGNNALSTGNLILSSGGTSNTLDLAGFSQTVGTLASSSTLNSGGTITSSVAGGALTLNEGGATGAPFAGTLFTGSLALKIVASNVASNGSGNIQVMNPSNTFSGGLTIQGASGTFTTANLAAAGAFTGVTAAGVRTNSAAALGTGTVTLDNGQLFVVASQNVSNNISVTSKGGILHMEGTGSGATGGFTGALTSSGTTLLVVDSNSGNSNIIKFTGDMSGFSGTMALDTTNIGGIALSGSALGNSNMNLLWSGAGTNGGTGRVQANSATSQTYTFGELNNLNSGAVGSSMSGIIEDNVASTTATFAVGDNNTSPATFQGVIRNGNGTVALTKNGSNTQILSGASTYTGATTVNAGTLNVQGSLAAGSAVTVNGGKLAVNGVVNSSVTVNGGGTLAGSGTATGVVTIAAGSTLGTQGAINLVDNSINTLTLSNASGLTLGGATGNSSLLYFEVGSSSSDLLSLGSNVFTINDGGASINLTSLGAVANQTYNLISFGSGAGTGFATGSGNTVGALTLANPNLSFGVTGSLNVTANQVQLVTSGAATPATAYWSGAKGSKWSDNDGTFGNFTTDQAGTNFVQAYPAATTDVFFANSGTSSNTLGQSFDIKSLSFLNGAGATIISGTHTLQIEAGGITVESGNGGATLSMAGLTLGADQTWSNDSTLTVTANVSGAHALSLTGTGTTVLAGANSYSGGTSIYGGTVQLGSASALGSTSAALAVNGGTLDLNNNSVSVGSLSGVNGGLITNTATGTATLTVGVTGSSTYDGTLSDGGSGGVLALTMNGSGILALTGSNSYSGGTTISAGTLQVGNGSALGTGNATVSSGATLDLNGQTLSNAMSVTGTGGNGAGGALINNSTTAAAINGTISNGVSFSVGGSGDMALQTVKSSGGNFFLTKDGTGTLYLSGTSINNLMGLVLNAGTVVLNKSNGGSSWAIDRGATVNGGTLKLGAAGEQIQTDQGVTMSAGRFDMNGFSQSINFLAGTGGTVTNFGAAASTLTIGATQFGSTTVSGTFSGVIQDGVNTVALAKSGTSSVTLTGNNSFSGGLSVNAGTIIVSGSISGNQNVAIAANANLDLSAMSAYALANGKTLTANGVVNAPASAGIDIGGTLLGSGTVNGGVNVQSNGTLATGASGNVTGTLTSSGNITFADGTAHLSIRLGETSGNDHDLLKLTGVGTTLSLNGADLKLTLGTSFVADGSVLVIIDNVDPSSGFTGAFAQGNSITVGSQTFDILYGYDAEGAQLTGGNDIALLAVPEPATWTMLLGGIGMLAFGQKLRRNRRS